MVFRGGYGIYTPTLGQFARAQGSGPFQITETYSDANLSGQLLSSRIRPRPARQAPRFRRKVWWAIL